jgi:hypothetical protein
VPISIIHDGKAAGVKEHFNKEKIWSHSTKILTSTSVILFITKKNFEMHINGPYINVKEALYEKYFDSDAVVQSLKQTALEFNKINTSTKAVIKTTNSEFGSKIDEEKQLELAGHKEYQE